MLRPSATAAISAPALFHGLVLQVMLQVMLDPGLAIEGDRMRAAHARLRTLLSEPG